MGPHLNVCRRVLDSELRAIVAAIDEVLLVDGAPSLLAGLERLAETRPPRTRTLDLIGHAAGDDRVLRMGELVVDARDPEALATFAAIRDRGLLARLGISAVRLLGCCTAMTAAGRATMAALAELLAVPVLGTTQLVHALHFGEDGLKARYRHLLVDAART